MPGGIHQVPRTPFDVRRMVAVEGHRLGYREEQVVAFVSAYHAERGYSPSFAIIRDELGFTDKAAVSRCVSHLVRKGIFFRARNDRRGRGSRGLSAILRLC